MTNERIQEIADVFSNNEELAKSVIEMEPADAAEAMKKAGYDCTADELIEFGKLVSDAVAKSENGELDTSDLDSVSGGSITVGVLVGAAAIGWAYNMGKAVGNRAW